MKRIGVLAVQGAFIEHRQTFERAGCEVCEIRQRVDAEQSFDAIVLPGGESTVQRKLLDELNITEPLWHQIDGGVQVFATCAGLILMAREVDGLPNPLGRVDVAVRRNAYGRQLGSFTTHGRFADKPDIAMTFIRAPKIIRTFGHDVEILSTYDGYPTAVRQNHIVALAFHPELNPGETILPDLLEL